MRTLDLLFALTAAASLAACGGGGGSADTSAPPPDVAKAPAASAPADAQVRIAGIKLAQSLLFPSDDSGLVLVAGKSTYVQVDVTGSAGAAKPAGTLHVQDSAGRAVRDLPLAAPTGAVPATVPDVPGPQASYSALLPGELVHAGLRLQASLANGATATIAPRVGGGVSIRIVEVPVQLGSATGTVVSGAAAYLLARMPVAGVSTTVHATYTSSSVSAPPTTGDGWTAAFSALLGELSDLQTLEGASSNDYYAGFVPKEDSGEVGLGYRPGHTIVVADWTNTPSSVRGFMTHELGHNLSLRHAPCGVSDADPAYPYANAALGEPGRYIWGYLTSTATWIDPRDTNMHDVMSYCEGTTFSDYSWRLMQAHLTPADATTASVAAARVAAAPQELLLVGGEIRGGRASLRPLKAARGTPSASAGPYTLRLLTPGGTLDVPFDVQEIDHDASRRQFSFTIAHPGEILGATILKDGTTLARIEAPAHPSRPTLRVQAASDRAPVRVTENAGRLQLSWDAARYPYLSVTWAGTSRQVLAQDLRGGSASLPLAGLAAGGDFEFSLSDGLNSIRATQAR